MRNGFSTDAGHGKKSWRVAPTSRALRPATHVLSPKSSSSPRPSNPTPTPTPTPPLTPLTLCTLRLPCRAPESHPRAVPIDDRVARLARERIDGPESADGARRR